MSHYDGVCENGNPRNKKDCSITVKHIDNWCKISDMHNSLAERVFNRLGFFYSLIELDEGQ